MVDDSLIKPIVNQNAFSVKSAKDKDLNDKKKRQNNAGQQHTTAEEEFIDDFNDSEKTKENGDGGEKSSLDFCA